MTPQRFTVILLQKVNKSEKLLGELMVAASSRNGELGVNSELQEQIPCQTLLEVWIGELQNLVTVPGQL